MELDINLNSTKWYDGKYILIDEGTYYYLYCSFHWITKWIRWWCCQGNYPIRIEKPLSRDAVINAAEMQAYGLVTAMDVASFNASLARKSREGEDNSDVNEHDEFISWVKDELTKIGI